MITPAFIPFSSATARIDFMRSLPGFILATKTLPLFPDLLMYPLSKLATLAETVQSFILTSLV